MVLNEYFSVSLSQKPLFYFSEMQCNMDWQHNAKKKTCKHIIIFTHLKPLLFVKLPKTQRSNKNTYRRNIYCKFYCDFKTPHLLKSCETNYFMIIISDNKPVLILLSLSMFNCYIIHVVKVN